MAEVLENWVPGGPLTEPGPESVRKGGRDEGWRGREREEKVGRMSKEDWQGGWAGRKGEERKERGRGGRKGREGDTWSGQKRRRWDVRISEGTGKRKREGGRDQRRDRKASY